ncbi:unnamed protein product [Linum tenue]|uniref:PARG catalytic Macro domain-containing protein n=1 Tax=Linum tenue TaxID=586396 RepID=A0AAV0L399_9ROSI|nr:unnamed protein product [Linum tenue]
MGCIASSSRTMEHREDMNSILPFLPVVMRSSSLFWPSHTVEAIKSLSKGPNISNVTSGESLFDCISDIRSSLKLSSLTLARYTPEGFVLFFDELISRVEARKWFEEVLPSLANLLLELPSLLESHYQNADDLICRAQFHVKTGLRLLGPQEAGMVFLSQVRREGLIEDQSDGALEVDFANKYLGGGALHRGCVQEEIRFMINPELIVGMLFLPCMDDNEAIEIVGAERFSNYTGYASSFRFSGDHIDQKGFDSFRRRKTRIVAIDALCNPRTRQYKLNYLLRETNKAFCGFFVQSKCVVEGAHCERKNTDSNGISRNMLQSDELPSSSTDVEMIDADCRSQVVENPDRKGSFRLDDEETVGIATGNWGCGAFGGDPELKAMIQWLAASQAARPSILYYTFGIEALQNLDKVVEWIASHEWVVEELWNMVVEYSSQRFNGGTDLGFLSWLLPSLSSAVCEDQEDGISEHP